MNTLPKLIATDLDHTLLDPEGFVSERTRNALDAARSAGIHVVPVTARQPVGLRQIAENAGFTEWALCSNGAFGIHLETSELLFTNETPPHTLELITTRLNERIPGLKYASVYDGGEGFVAEEGYAHLAAFIDHKRDPRHMGGAPLEAVIEHPSLKLVVRHPEIAPHDIAHELSGLGLPGFEVTLSGAPFVEIMAENVTKASGLEELCGHLGVAQSEVIAFGDARNDIEMIEWAGHGVAVANALESVMQVADEVTASNADDGVALVIERVLAQHHR